MGCIAKIYAENQESQTCVVFDDDRPSSSPPVSWVSWRVRVQAEVTSEWVTSLARHSVQVRLWDTKDKLNTDKAKTDKPKRFKMLDGTKDAMVEAMKEVVFEVSV